MSGLIGGIWEEEKKVGEEWKARRERDVVRGKREVPILDNVRRGRRGMVMMVRPAILGGGLWCLMPGMLDGRA